MTPFMQKAMLAVMWVLWCTLHSLLIARTTTGWLREKLGQIYAYYRLFYVLVSIITLIPILYWQMTLPRSIIFVGQGCWYIPQFLLAGYGLTFMAGGFAIYDLRFMLGIRQIKEHWQGQPEKQPDFECQGILEYVRHPWYTAGLALLWTFTPVTDVDLIGRIILSIYLVVGAFLEEKKLLLDFGDYYKWYRRTVPMYFPWRLLYKKPRGDREAGPN